MAKKQLFGYVDEKPVYNFTISSSKVTAEILNYGAVLRSLKVKKDDKEIDVVLGFDTLNEYLVASGRFGAIIGRFANRINNGEFFIDGIKYQVSKNRNGNCLHGGVVGFDKKVWDFQLFDNALELKLFSPDGEEGFPGNLDVCVRYSVDDEGLQIEYSCISDKDTIVNFTNHAYFNLNGEGVGNVDNHKLTLWASCYTPSDSRLIPTGEIVSVVGTPFDFLTPKAIGKDIDDSTYFALTKGYDHNYVLDGEGFRKVAEAVGNLSNLKMQLYTDICGMQFYSGNAVNVVGKCNHTYGARSAFCLETQFFPDAINHKNFPSPIVRKGQLYKTKTKFCFH